MTSDQNRKYFGLCGKVSKVLPGFDRKAFHREHGLPESHLEFSEEHFDEFIGRCKAILRSGDFRAQHKQVEMPATRKRWFIRAMLAALGRGDEYAEAIIARMSRNQRQRWTGAGAMTTLDTLCMEGLKDVVIALKKECRRDWKTKAELLGEIYALRAENDFDELATAGAVMQALSRETLPALDELVYEDLLIVLGVLRGLSQGPAISSPAEVEESNVPF